MDNIYQPKVSGRLLISGSPLMVLPLLAVKIGLNEALVLQQIHYWISNELNKNIRDGRVWVYNTINEWRKQFPFWGLNTIIRAIESLESKKLIITGKYNKLARDRTKWYTIDYDSVECLDVGTFTQNETFHLPKMGKPIYPEWVNVLPETTTEISTNIKKNNKKSFDSEFDEFWAINPKPVDKEESKEVFNKLLSEDYENFKRIMDGRRAQNVIIQLEGTERKYIKGPASWLRKRKFNDEVPTKEQLHEENRRSVNKLANPTARTKTDRYHTINAGVRENAIRRIEAIEREEEALEREERRISEIIASSKNL